MTCASDPNHSGGIFDFDRRKEELEEINRELEQPNVWNDPEHAQKLGQERARLEKIVLVLEELVNGLDDAGELLDMAVEENDEDSAQAVQADLTELEKKVEELEFRRMFSGEMDACNAFLDIQAGSGGTEAQDWAEMLLRMYLRWAEAHGFTAELIEASAGDVAGIKSATVHVTGDYAFGRLRTETELRRAIDDSRAAYTLGYEPSHDEWNGKFRRIEVRTTRPGVRLRHRRGYFAQPAVPTDDGYRRGVLEAATWSPMDATGVGLTVRVAPSKDGGLTLALRLHAPDVSLRPAGGRWRGQLDIWLVQLGPGDTLLDTVSHVAGLSLSPADHQRVMRTNEMVLMERLKPKEDAVLLRILVRDLFSGALGSVSIPLDRIEPNSP